MGYKFIKILILFGLTSKCGFSIETINNSRFQPFEDSYVVFQRNSKDERGIKDDEALRAKYSFQYILANCNFDFKEEGSAKDKCQNKSNVFETAFTYTGDFDFYFNVYEIDNSRISGPVITRMNNPALYFRLLLDKSNRLYKRDSIDVKELSLSFEHRSNGQSRDVVTEDDRPQRAFDREDYKYFDAISRSANYLKLGAKYIINPDSGHGRCKYLFYCIESQFTIKHYFSSEESDITWGSRANEGFSFKDFDVYNFRFVDKYLIVGTNQDMILDIEYKIGESGLDGDSFDINFVIPLKININKVFNIPLMFHYHNGPMDRLSDYANDYESYGIGLSFMY